MPQFPVPKLLRSAAAFPVFEVKVSPAKRGNFCRMSHFVKALFESFQVYSGFGFAS